jgi:hypothetical protein
MPLCLEVREDPLGPTPFQYNPNPHMGSSRSRPTCQVCGKLGHSAFICYNRFNQAYQASGPNLTAYNAMATSSQDLN